MFAIVRIAGQQFKVEQGRYLYVNRMPQAAGETVELTDVLMVGGNGSPQVGAPTVAGAKVIAKVLEHAKGDKLWVFKKKRRKGYQKLNGHRQALTKIQIESLTV